MTNKEVERRINNAYMDGRADAIDEMIEKILDMPEVSDFTLRELAEQMKEEQ